MRRAILILLLLTILAAPFAWGQLVRPPRSETHRVLFQGVTYTRLVRQEPAQLVHVVEIDLTAPGIELLVTPGNPDGTFPGLTTAEFLKTFGTQVAINGSFYSIEDGSQNLLRPVGQIISGGVTYTNGRFNRPVLCILPARHIIFEASGFCPPGTEHGLAGNALIVEEGRPYDPATAPFSGGRTASFPQPRTAVGVDQSGHRLWLFLVDGRQPGYSQGITLIELAELMTQFDVYQALNLDGGGSTTLVVESWLGARTLNSPIHNGLPTRQRPVATHLGIFAAP